MSQKIEMGKKYRTRSGKNARVLSVTENFGQGLTVVAVVEDYAELGKSEVFRFRPDGKFVTHGEYPLDLIEVKPVREAWINIYRDDDNEDALDGSCYMVKHSAAEAKAHTGTMGKHLIARIPITFTEGEGLEESDGGC